MMNRSIVILCSLDLTVLTSFSVVRVTFAGARQNLVTEFEMRAMISMKLNPEMWETDWVTMVVVTQLLSDHGTTSALSDGLAICIRACPLEISQTYLQTQNRSPNKRVYRTVMALVLLH